MRKFKSRLLIIICLALSACATNYEEEKTVLLEKNEQTDLVSTFDVGGEQAEQFKAQMTTEGAKPVEAKTPDIKSSQVKPTKEKGSKTPVKDIAKETRPTPIAAPAPTAEAPVEVLSEAQVVPPATPSDYPEEYKIYDAKSRSVWAKFKPIFYKGEQSIMSVTYLGVTAGYITIYSKEVVRLNNKNAFHFYARFKSSDAYRYFYWLDDRLDSYVEQETFLPMKYTLIQREKRQNVDDLQLFDFQKAKTYHWYKRVKEGSNRDDKVEKTIPMLAQDSFSALQFVRGLPLKKGDIYEFPVVTRGKFWLLKVEVVGEETIEIADNDVRAVKIRAETNFPGVLKKSGDIYFWYGTDPERRLLKFQAKIKIGSVNGELVEYKPGVKVQ